MASERASALSPKDQTPWASSWTMGWRNHSLTLIPVSFGIGRVLIREGMPPINLSVSGEWMAYRQFAPIAPQTTVRFGMTIAFPDYRPW